MFDKDILTPEEKLDYVYEYVKSQKRNNIIKGIIKTIIRLLFITYLLYSYFILWPQLKTNYIEPILKPFWIQSFSVEDFKTFFSNFANSSWSKSSDNWIQIWNTWIKLDQKQIDQIKNALLK